MKTLKEKIEVMQAALDGKDIQFQFVSEEIWRDFPKVDMDDVFMWGVKDFRIKPEPLEFWVNVYGGVYQTRAHPTKAAALNECKNSQAVDVKTIKVREVTE